MIANSLSVCSFAVLAVAAAVSPDEQQHSTANTLPARVEQMIDFHRSNHFRDTDRKNLRESWNQSNGSNAKARLVFEKIHSAGANSRSSRIKSFPQLFGHRELHSDSCDYHKLLDGRCSIDDFCHFLSQSDYSTQQKNYCSGHSRGSSASWQVVSTYEEACFYIDEDEELPYDASRFNADTDFCYVWSGAASMADLTALRYDIAVEVTKPLHGFYKESYDLESCDEAQANQDIGFLPGYCSSCAAVEIEGQQCNSCQSCPTPESSLASMSVDCTNVDPTLVTTCDGEDGSDKIFESFVEYMGADCTFSALLKGHCSLPKFCSQVQAIEEAAGATCTGHVGNHWSVTLERGETCFYHSSQEDAVSFQGGPFEEEKFDPTLDYCIRTSLQVFFHQSVATVEDFSYEITRPMNEHGTVREVSRLSPCDDSDNPDHYFDRAYCYQGCPTVEIGGARCTQGCHLCDDGYEALDCSNLGLNMVESCSTNVNDDFTEDILKFFGRIRKGKGHQGVARMGGEEIQILQQQKVAVTDEDAQPDDDRSASAVLGTMRLVAIIIAATHFYWCA